MGKLMSTANPMKRRREDSEEPEDRRVPDEQENRNPNRAKKARIEDEEDEEQENASHNPRRSNQRKVAKNGEAGQTVEGPGTSSEHLNPRRSNRFKRVEVEDLEDDEQEVAVPGSSSENPIPKWTMKTRRSTTQGSYDVERAADVPGTSSDYSNPRRSLRWKRAGSEEANEEEEQKVEGRGSSSEHKAPRRSMCTRKFKVPESEEKAVVEVEESSGTPLSCCNLPERLRYHVPNDQCSYPQAGCRIFPGHRFHLYDYGGKKQKYCEEHYAIYNMPEDQKERFFKLRKNENKNFEETVACSKCKKKVHRICVLHVDNDSNPLCLSCGNGPMIYKPVRALHRNEPRSTVFMMRKLNGFLKGTSISIEAYTTSGTSKIENVVPKHLVEKFHGPLEYKKRAIYLYQKQDSVDVLFFALYCREYQNENGGGGWFVVDYLDSVPFFEGAQKRELYPKILLAYFEFMSRIGILNGFLHADPPVQGDDYVFNIHPKTQAYKSEKDLIRWYRKIFNLGKQDGIVKSFRTFQEECALRKFQSPTDIPLFEGALWSKAVREANPKDFDNAMKIKYKEHSNDNFFLELEAPKSIEKDDETFNENPIMVDRLKFLDFCQRKNWEFGSLRHAKFSSVSLAKWLEEEDRK